MNRTRITKIGLLMLGTAIIGWTVPAQAGFEFTAPPAPAKAQNTAPEDALNAPMPIVPTETVTAEPLDQAASFDDHVLKAPSVADESAEPVYIRRQRSNMVMTAPKNQPMDTASLLKATENGEMIELEGQPRPNLAAADEGALVIDPYPLDSDEGASHGNAMGKAATEQALMEQGGNLRTVAVPGKTAPGMIARAKMTSRYDTASQYMDRAPIQEEAAVEMSSSMTPIPGGEGEPLGKISRVSAAPLPPPAPQVKLEAEKPAVAAAPAPAMPQPITPPAVAEAKTPRAPVVEARISRADSMPRPATPEGSLPKAAMKASAQKTEEQPQPQQVAAVAPAPAAPASGEFTEAVGFGRDLPLALALSQVVPPEYSYAFGADVNVGSTVSWQGGKPWNQVMDDMLASQGLRAVIAGNKITIIKSGQPA